MKLIERIQESMDDLKAQNITVVDFKNTSPLYDAFVICDAQSTTQVKAIKTRIENDLAEEGYEIHHQASTPNSEWLIVDALDVVAHIFTTEERKHYDLDKLYQEFIRE